MAIQLSVTLRNARLDAIETILGSTFILELRSGDPPANCAASSSGNLLARATIPADSPSDAWAAAASGSKSKIGTWTLTGLGSGIIGHFRMFQTGSPDVCHVQGTVGPTGSPSYDMTVDNVNIALDQVVTVNTATFTDGNA